MFFFPLVWEERAFKARGILLLLFFPVPYTGRRSVYAKEKGEKARICIDPFLSSFSLTRIPPGQTRNWSMKKRNSEKKNHFDLQQKPIKHFSKLVIRPRALIKKKTPGFFV